MSYSSSQSSVYSAGSELKSAEHSTSPKMSQESKRRGDEDRDIFIVRWGQPYIRHCFLHLGTGVLSPEMPGASLMALCPQ